MARASASMSPWSCRHWATSTGWQKWTSELIISTRGLARVDRLELAALDAVAQDHLDHRADELLVRADGVPVVLHRDQDDVVNALIRQVIFLVIGEDLEEQALDPLRRRAARASDRPGALLELAQATLADRLDDRVLGGEEPVDVGRRHPELGRDVGHRRLGEAEPAEQRLRGLHDAGAGVVGLGLCLRVHARSRPLLISDELHNSSGAPCQAPARSQDRRRSGPTSSLLRPELVHAHECRGGFLKILTIAHQAGRPLFSSSPHRCRRPMPLQIAVASTFSASRREGCHEFCVNVIHQHNLLAKPAITFDPRSHGRWLKAGAVVRSTKRTET